jgi:hypothetical protein
MTAPLQILLGSLSFDSLSLALVPTFALLGNKDPRTKGRVLWEAADPSWPLCPECILELAKETIAHQH